MIFIDTSILFAAVVSSDGRFEDARRVLNAIGTESQLTTDHVLVETWKLLRAKRGRIVANGFWTGLRHAPVTIEFTTPADLERAHAIAETWKDQDFDIVDCSSFAVMERVGCYRAATFDDHFAVYRTGSGRTRAFEIIR